jgi:hypothetical protein|tara:strand:+ start:132 stop:722 length:591 start_codon:yes stop_codon:yes gene_type:complete
MSRLTRPSRLVSDQNIERFLRLWKNPFVERARWIESLVKEHGWTTGAELGVMEGRVFLYLLWKCQELTMHGVDVWVQKGVDLEADVLEDFNSINYGYYKNIKELSAGYNVRSITHRTTTTKASQKIEDKSLDFIFIDADHSYEQTKNDILTWSPKVKDGGMILGHDLNWDGVRIAVNELLPNFKHSGVETCWYVTK